MCRYKHFSIVQHNSIKSMVLGHQERHFILEHLNPTLTKFPSVSQYCEYSNTNSDNWHDPIDFEHRGLGPVLTCWQACQIYVWRHGKHPSVLQELVQQRLSTALQIWLPVWLPFCKSITTKLKTTQVCWGRKDDKMATWHIRLFWAWCSICTACFVGVIQAAPPTVSKRFYSLLNGNTRSRMSRAPASLAGRSGSSQTNDFNVDLAF